MPKDTRPTRTVFVVFREVPKMQDVVDAVGGFFERLSKGAGPKWQIDILGPSLPSGKVLLFGVLEAIKRADLVIIAAGEFSNNVAFELGLAYGLDKDKILLAPKGVLDKIQETFSDIAGVKCALYDPDRIIRTIPEVLKRELHALNTDRVARVSRSLSPDYLVALGDMLQMEGLYVEAIAKYEAACDLDPKNVRYLVRLGQGYAASYDLNRAEEILRRAVNADSKCAFALDTLAQVLLDAGKYENAIDDCLKPLISLFPKAESYYYKVAVAFVELGEPEKAANFLEAASGKGANLPRVLYDLAWTSVRASKKYRAQKREEWILLALDALKRAVSSEPSLRQRAAADQDFDIIRDRPGFPG